MAGGWAEGGGLGLEGPGDVVVPLLHQPLVLQRPYIVADEASVAALGDLLEVLFVEDRVIVTLVCSVRYQVLPELRNLTLPRTISIVSGHVHWLKVECDAD